MGDYKFFIGFYRGVAGTGVRACEVWAVRRGAMDVIWVRRNVSMDISVADLARSKSLSIMALFVCSTIS